jgi:arsenate reductase (glutaredoxin)
MVTIYHNPGCGTSRNTLGLIRNSGAKPTIIEYLRSPPERSTLTALIAAMGIPVRNLLRQKGTPYEELGLGNPQWRDDELISFMLAYPLLIDRPIVVTPLGTALCRPSERVLELLSSPQQGEFRKEDGELVIDPRGRRIARAD